MKNLKQQEILERLRKIEKVSGKSGMGFDHLDLEQDFDPEKHDQTMQTIFGDNLDEDFELDEEGIPIKPHWSDEEIGEDTNDLIPLDNDESYPPIRLDDESYPPIRLDDESYPPIRLDENKKDVENINKKTTKANSMCTLF